MNGNRIDRRDLCKSLLALGGVALTGAALDAQQTTPAPGIIDPALQDQRVADAVKRGASMEEIAQLREPIARNPQEAIRPLKMGNSRFFSGASRLPKCQPPNAARRFSHKHRSPSS